MWTVKNKGGSPVKGASINKNLLRQAELLGLSGDAARIAAAGAQIAEISGKKLPLMPAERTLPPPMDWSLNGSFNLWLDANNPLYFEKIGAPTLARKKQILDKTFMSQFSCEMDVNAGDGIRQIVSLWAGDDAGPNIYDPQFEVPWTLLLHICDAQSTTGSWRLRLGWKAIPPGAPWSAYRETVFEAIRLPQFKGEVWPAVMVHLPPKADAVGELTFELVAQTTGKILIDSFQLLPAPPEAGYDQAGYPIWAPPALQPVEIDWAKDGVVGGGTYRMGHVISPIKLSAFKVTGDFVGDITTFTPRVDGVNMANLAVTLGSGVTAGMAHYPQGYYCSLNSLLDVITDSDRGNVCATLFGIRLPW